MRPYGREREDPAPFGRDPDRVLELNPTLSFAEIMARQLRDADVQVPEIAVA